MAVLAGLFALYAVALLAVPAVRPALLRHRFLIIPWTTAGHLADGATAGLPFDSAYPAIAWLCWVPNLAAAEWWLRRGAWAAPLSS